VYARLRQYAQVFQHGLLKVFAIISFIR